jgi:hypothetical protein
MAYIPRPPSPFELQPRPDSIYLTPTTLNAELDCETARRAQPSSSVTPPSRRGSSDTVYIPHPPSAFEVRPARESIYLTPTTSSADLLEVDGETTTSLMPSESTCAQHLSSPDLPTRRYLFQRVYGAHFYVSINACTNLGPYLGSHNLSNIYTFRLVTI